MLTALDLGPVGPPDTKDRHMAEELEAFIRDLRAHAVTFAAKVAEQAEKVADALYDPTASLKETEGVLRLALDDVWGLLTSEQISGLDVHTIQFCADNHQIVSHSDE